MTAAAALESVMDAEIADIVVTLTNDYAERTDEAVAAMAAIGFHVVRVTDDHGVIEGTIDTAHLAALEELEPVSYVRTSLRYHANFPPGDPRDRDDK